MKTMKFTLIEMVVVCAILLFLSAGLFALGNVLFKKYFIMQGKMEMLKIQNAITAYKSATGNYPPDYKSSSHNEDGDLGASGSWGVYYMKDVSPSTNLNLVRDLYEKVRQGDRDFPVAIGQGTYNYGPVWAVLVWSWGGDIGGLEPALAKNGLQYGYICQPPFCGQEPCIAGDFMPITAKDYYNSVLCIFTIKVELDVTKSYKCKYGAKGSLNKPFVCGSDPSDMGFSCGWHSFNSENWENGHNSGETAKALYDYLARPMKGRMKDGKPTNPKYENCKPFIELSNKLVHSAGRPPPMGCDNSPLKDTPTNYKIFGDGIYGLNDSYEIVDVWGNEYLYVSSAPEYVTPNSSFIKPYQSKDLGDSSLSKIDALNIDIYSPFFNPTTYDLGSKGPDGKAVNWIPMDFQLYSPSGYENAEGDVRAVSANTNQGVFSGEEKSLQRKYIFGQGSDQYFKLPSESLKLIDFDNDNITNFYDNGN